MGGKLISVTEHEHPDASTRSRLAAHLREEARATRAAMPPVPPSPTGHRIDVDSMRAYADLCERIASGLGGGASVYDEIRTERERQIAKGRDAAHDDGRWWSEWLSCLYRVVEKRDEGAYGQGDSAWRTLWIKVGSIAVAAVESYDRRAKS